MAAVTAVATAAMASNMPRPDMLRADTLAFVLAAHVVTVSGDKGAALHEMRGAAITRLAPAGDAAVAGEAITGIRTTDIPGLAITVWATIIHTTGITAVTRIMDIIPILIATDTGRIGA